MSLAQKLARLADIFGGPGYAIPFSNRNYIVDGNFEQWINTTLSVAAGATVNNAATMFYSGSGAGGAATIVRGTFPVGADPVGSTSPVAFYYQHQQTTAATTTPVISQKIESIRTLQGRSATFSCWLSASSPITITTISVNQNYGGGGSPSPTIQNTYPVNWVLGTALKRFSVRLDMPSTAGGTLGTSGNDFVNLSLVLPTGVTFTLNTSQWQLEQSSPNSSSDINGNGGDPTAFEYRGQQAELARVQRYYYVSPSPALTLLSNGAAAFGGAVVNAPFPVPMRASPTVVPTFTSGVSSAGSANGATPLTVSFQFSSAQAVGNYTAVNFTADARL
jgi:hypothetical protein